MELKKFEIPSAEEISNYIMSVKLDPNNITRDQKKNVQIILALGTYNLLNEATRYFNKLEEVGIPLTIELYLAFIRVLVFGKEIQLAEYYIKLLKLKFTLAIPHYNILIGLYLKNNRLKEVENLFEEIRFHNLTFDNSTFNKFLEYLDKICATIEERLPILQEMKRRKYFINPEYFVPFFISNGKINELKEYFSPSELHELFRHENLLVKIFRLFERESKCNELITFLQVLDNKQINLPLHIVNEVLNILFQISKSNEVEDFIKQLMTKKIEFDIATFNILISGYARTGKFDESFKWLKEMVNRNLAFDQITFNILLNTFSKLGMLDKMMEIFSEMKGKGHYDAYAYSIVIFSLGKAGKMQEVKNLLQEIKQNNIQLTEIAYCTIFEVFGENDAEEMFFYIEEMKSNKIPITISIYNTVLNKMLKMKNLHGFKKYLQEAEEKGLQFDQFTYSLLFRYATLINDINLLETYYLEMIRFNIPMDIIFFGNLLNAYGQAGNFDKVNSLLNQMKEKNIYKNNTIYNILIKSYIAYNKKTELEALFQEYLNDPINPPITWFFNYMIEAYAKEGNISIVRKIYNNLHQKKLLPNDITFYNIFSAISNASKNNALDLSDLDFFLEEMIKYKFPLTGFEIKTAANSYIRQNHRTGFLQVIKLGFSHNIKSPGFYKAVIYGSQIFKHSEFLPLVIDSILKNRVTVTPITIKSIKIALNQFNFPFPKEFQLFSESKYKLH